MARKNQKLINYHGSGNTPDNLLSQIDYGEIAVKHSTGNTAQLIIKTSDETSAIFVESAAVVSMIDSSISSVAGNVVEIAKSLSAVSSTTVATEAGLEELKGYYSAFTSDVTTNLSGSVSALSASVVNNYWTSATTQGKLDAITSQTQTLTTNLQNLSGAVSAFSATVVADYTTHAEASGMRDTAITSAQSYTDTISGYIVTDLHEHYWTSATTQEKLNAITSNTESLTTNLQNLSGAVSAFSASVVSMSADVKTYIDDKLSVVYKFKGSVDNYADLANISQPENGDVYNVVNANGTIGQPGYTPAGTNYAWNETGSTWDALGGTIDLSSYVTQDELDGVTGNVETITQDLGNLYTYFSGFSGSIVSGYTTHAEASGMRDTAITSAQSYTNTVSGDISNYLYNNYWNSATTQENLNAINSQTETLTSNLQNLSGAVSAFSANVVTDIVPKVNSALQGFGFTGDGVTQGTGNQTLQSGAKADYTTGGTATLDLTELIIDCGDW